MYSHPRSQITGFGYVTAKRKPVRQGLGQTEVFGPPVPIVSYGPDLSMATLVPPEGFWSSIGTSITGALPSIVKGFTTLAPIALQTYTQLQTIKAQKSAADRQAAANVASLTPVSPGQATLQSTIPSAPGIRPTISMPTSVPTWAWVAGGGAGILFLIFMMSRRR